MSPRRWILLAVLFVCGGLAAACSGADPGPSGGEQASPTPVPVTMTRTGGIAGVSQSIEVAVDGSWTYKDLRQNTSERGTMTEAQQAQLAKTISDPGFADQVAKKAPDNCADAFRYTISLGGETMSFEDCGDDERPAVKAAIAVVTEATPF